ncbi:MAG TPA: hypothetical protein VKO45_05950 [Methanomicrobiales archaeon]|nr:hypothetical protein [Methanomicrobiales archaeon]
MKTKFVMVMDTLVWFKIVAVTWGVGVVVVTVVARAVPEGVGAVVAWVVAWVVAGP